MPTNKQPLIRYKILDKCFKNTGRRYFIQDLIDECTQKLVEIDPTSRGVSRSQIFEDIKFMESSEGWSIELERLNEGKKVYYRYADPKFSINNMPLNEIEIQQLKYTVDILAQFKGMPQFEWVYELIPKLQQDIKSSGKNSIIMDFDNNPDLKGIEFLGLLYQAIFYKKVLLVSYQPYEVDTPIQMEVHPYYLKQYNRRWFLFGYKPNDKISIWNLALDRIVNFNEIKKPYIENTQIDWEDYFYDIIGVTKPPDAEVTEIIMHVLGKTGYYIETKPFHPSQKSKWVSDNVLEIKLKLIINYELIRLLLSYGESLIVKSPESLKSSILDSAKEIIKAYQ